MSQPRRQCRCLWPALLLAVAAALACCLPSPAGADEAADEFAVAAAHYTQQRWKLAAESFEAFLDRFPRHARANQVRFLLGETLLQLGRPAEAGRSFRAYLVAAPEGEYARSALFRVGESAYLDGQHELAATDLARFLEQYPDDAYNAYVLPYLGDMAMARNDAAAAAGHFRRGLERFPDGRLQDDCRYGLGRALIAQGQPDEAERLLTALAGKASSPLADDAQFQLGALYYATGKYEQAAAALAALGSQWPASPLRGQAAMGRGWSLMKLKRFADARALFESLAEDAQLGIEARYWAGMTLKAEEHWRRAAEVLLAAAAFDERHELALAARFHAGDALLRAGDTDRAMREFDGVLVRGLKGNEWFDDALCGAAQAAVAAGKHATVDQLAADFNRLCPQSDLAADMTRLHARSLLERKRFDEAASLLAPLTKTEQNEHRLQDLYLLAVAYEGLNRYDDALAIIAPVLATNDRRLKADALLRQASMLVALKRYEAAIAPLEACLALGPEGDSAVKARGELAACYARTGKLSEAKRAYAELLTHHGKHRLIPAATEQLAEAVYEAKDAEWAGQLFARLRELGRTEVAGAPVRRDETEIKALAGLGWSQFKAGRYAEAELSFDQLLKQAPPPEIEAEAALVRGQSLEQLGRLDPALAMYDLVIDEHPKSPQHPQALLAAARLRDKLQQDKEAAALYERLATQYPRFDRLDAVLYEWAWVLHDLDRAQDADQLFERLRKDFAESRFAADAAYRLAERAYAVKDFGRAKQLAAEVISGQGDVRVKHHARLLEGRVAVSEGDWEAVRATFETLARQSEGADQLIAEFWVAEALFRREQYDVAEKRLAELAAKGKGRAEPWLAMVPLRQSQLLMRQGEWVEARALAESIARQYPNFEQQYEADFVIGRCLHAQAELAAAREAFTRVVRSPRGEKTETAAMAQWWIGAGYFHQKDYEAAAKEFFRLETLYAFPEWQAAALLEAGKCRELQGDRKEAAVLYQRLLSKYPETRYAKQAGELLGTVSRAVPASAPPTVSR